NEVPGAQWWLYSLRARESDAAIRPWPDAAQDAFAALGHWCLAMYVVPIAILVIVLYAVDRDVCYRNVLLIKRVLAAFSG
ncbi:serine hydrolase, partial [Pseudomonas sp. RTI1]|nr:serine hydrolase [Pseudomonas sp. RTI1]